MPYAINSTNNGWRAINEKADLLPGETYSENQPILVPTLDQAKENQVESLVTSYETAIYQPVSFTTSAGIVKTYQADLAAITSAQQMLAAFTATGIPTGFYWVAQDNTQVSFTLADLQGLAKAMGEQGWTAFQKLQTLKASVMAATTVAAVQAIVW